MALLQTDRESGAWLTGSARFPARHVAHGLADLSEYVWATIRHWLRAMPQWSARREVRAWRTTVERARQRRALARLSDRELRDIGITRYEIEFLLRQPRRR